MAKERFRETADYTVSAGPDGYCFRFYCAVSGALLCVAGPIRQGSQDTALETAWQTVGRSHFNQCHRCGRWVSDVMYNADALECVECAPWKIFPHFCPHCGARVSGAGDSCARCGVRLPGAKEPGEYYQRIRRIGMEQYGFGPDAMKKRKVCRACGAAMSSEEEFCRGCGAILPKETLFDLYRAKHFYCPACGAVMADPPVSAPSAASGCGTCDSH